ncbi:hypothetical protein [Gimesia panareensis]|uniref:hypothetical protein n=1 Tax=Gimesia panareensis TaxID=2527978 RepID=UPI00118C1B8D|nr:hypothetical protein [Gimesia panareensis]QDU51163.1 hypothetical protein Pan110_35260 [Gimesia panareensis]
MVKRIQLLAIVSALLIISGASVPSVQGTPKKRIITTLSLEKDAPQVELFEGLKKQSLSARVYPISAYNSSVFITNKTAAPLTVKVPPAVSSVHILAQVGGPGQGAGLGQGLLSDLQGLNKPVQGNSQAVGGNLSPVGNNQNQNFQGLFTIPPEKTVKLQLRSVCLEHGKPCPTSAKTYELRPIESQVQDKALVLLLQKFNPRRDDWEMMQAIAWHLASHMDWQKLASKRKQEIVGGGVPYFTSEQLVAARKVVEVARVEVHRHAAAARHKFSDKESEADDNATLSRIRIQRR